MTAEQNIIAAAVDLAKADDRYSAYLALSLDEAIGIVQSALRDLPDGGMYAERVRLRRILDERLKVVIETMKERATPMVGYAGTVERPPLSIDLEE